MTEQTKKATSGIPTVSQIVHDRITQIAAQYWAPFSETHKVFDANKIAEIYKYELLQSNFATKRIMLLEFSQYLECYLWPNYDYKTSSLEHVLSIVAMVNEKFRERVPAWEVFKEKPQEFNGFFRRVMEAALDSSELTFQEQTVVVAFLVNCVGSLEVDLVRTQLQKLVCLPIWSNLLAGHRESLFAKSPKFKKFWNVLSKHDAKLNERQLNDAKYEREFFARLLTKFASILGKIPTEGEIDPILIRYCERILELLIDLESLLPTRRFFNALLDGFHVVTKCQMSNLTKRPEGRLFCQLLEMLHFYARFEIDDLSGEQLTENDMTDMHYKKIASLQKAAFTNFREELGEFYLLNVSSVDTNSALNKFFGALSKENVYKLAEFLHLVPPMGEDSSIFDKYSTEFLVQLLVYRHEKRIRQLEMLNELPLYPTEDVIWDENVVPNEYFNGEGCLALNKLNLQFLTLYDYLLRNFRLFRLESTYEIRQDIEDALFRLKPWKHEESDKNVVFGGWARMALQINTFSIVEVSKPNIGERSPSSVRADVTVTLNARFDIKSEWENLRRHDVCFLVTVRPLAPVGTKYDIRRPFHEQIQVAYVRGCEIEGMIGPDGRVIEEYSFEAKPQIPGHTRTFRVWLDCNQYRNDMERNVKGEEDVYDSFNLIVRRKPKENNFKAVLDTIRQLMNTSCVVPAWLHDVLLGYGDPSAAHYSKMNNVITELDFNDTFLDYEHLMNSFPEYKITTTIAQDGASTLTPPFKLTFKDLAVRQDADCEPGKEIVVEEVSVVNRGPYPYLAPKTNSIRFTPTQIEAIKSGMQPGLTLVVGPPGTGKTDVAVQIIANIYHNWPDQRTLLITHSNQALNQLFEKIMQLDVDERHLLRLGHGEEALETEKDFSRYGRVNYVLAKRLELLKEVERLQSSLGVRGDVSYTCETASHFYLYQVHARWEQFESLASKGAGDASFVEKHFPFNEFFSNAPQPLFKKVKFEDDLETARGCWRHISRIFKQLDEFRAFELLRTGRDRTEYLLVKEAKIIAMTCTHAALRRRDLVELGFRYDNVLMEESAQILEIETFIPLLLQEPQDGRDRLKRWIMIGDHHQLPPVIKNMAFQKYSNMEQSLFTRLVRLGVPTVDLDMQGRARSSIATLYNWRYKRLSSLPHIDQLDEYKRANAGFAFNYQLINVNDYNGVGESAPSPYFYQNLAEAEYVVAMFMYMRLLGYPAQKISILTTYNGQKHLLRDIIQQRCANNPLIGKPQKITTVDKYQGQQNDYILLSLVRTFTVGHVRDVRRLVVALSRARLGLYVFCRVSLFRNCFELTPAFNILCKRTQKLSLVPNELWPTERKTENENLPMEPMEIEDMPHMAQFVYEFYKANEDSLKAMWMQTQGMFDAPLEKLQPYSEGGSVEKRKTLSAEQVSKEEGKRVEKDIEFEVLVDESTPVVTAVPTDPTPVIATETE